MFLVAVLLAVELLDEFVFGTREAAWPLIRSDLHLHYAQIGLILGLPAAVAGLIEPLVGVLSDAGRRRILLLGGGALFAAALFLFAGSSSLALLLVASVLLYPASGAFVSLSQTILMDVDPARRERNMAVWTGAGSVGALIGPLVLALLIVMGLSWRLPFVAAGAAALALVPAIALRWHAVPSGAVSLREAFAGTARALRRRDVLRWLLLLEASDLLLDVLLGFLALYLVASGASPGVAALAISGRIAGDLAGNVVLIPALRRIDGLSYVRWSAFVALPLFAAFLLTPNAIAKVIVVVLLAFTSAGWYPVLKARLYMALPDQSGTVMALSGLTSPVAAIVPVAVGVAAQHFGLQGALWLLLLGPILLFVLPTLDKMRSGH